jgi:hypothetical protein
VFHVRAFYYPIGGDRIMLSHPEIGCTIFRGRKSPKSESLK